MKATIIFANVIIHIISNKVLTIKTYKYMKAIISYRDENKQNKCLPFFNSEKLVDFLCESKFGKCIAFALYYVLKVDHITFE